MDLAKLKSPYPVDATHATILITSHSFPTGASYLTYQWEGDKRLPVFIHRRENINELPWPLKCITPEGDRLWTNTREYVRTDVDFGLTAVAWFVRRHAGAWATWVYVRLIVTAAVWGLADHDPYRRVSWRDLKIVKRFKQRKQ